MCFQIRTIDPVNVEHILKTNFRNYVKPHKLRRAMLEMVGDGIFRINHGFKGEYDMWHRQRKTMANIFFRKNFEGFMQHVFVRHAHVMCDVLRQHAAGQTTVDVQRTMFCYTLDSIAEIGFGVHFDSLRKSMHIADCFDDAQVSVFAFAPAFGGCRCRCQCQCQQQMPTPTNHAHRSSQETVFLRLLRPFYSTPVLGKLMYVRSAHAEMLCLRVCLSTSLTLSLIHI